MDLSRREFMIAGSTSLLTINGDVTRQISSSRSNDEYKFDGVADLIGPKAARPEPGDGFFEPQDRQGTKLAYAYRYEAQDTGERYFIEDGDDAWTNISMPLEDYSTPYDVLKTAKQQVQFAVDPSKTVTRRRYAWYSNNSLFDNTFVTANDNEGVIEIATSATGSDTARIRSAIAGQYVSQTLAKAGLGLQLADSDVQFDSNGYVSTTNGIVAVGAGWHDGSSGGWGAAANGGPIQTFLGRIYKPDGAYAVCISNGQHVFGSPVPQSDWSIDDLSGQDDTDNPSGEQLRPDSGTINNWPYTWYAFGALYDGIVSSKSDEEILTHQFEPEGSSLDRPNLPPMVVLDNNGTADGITASLGGMQFSIYGANINEGDGGEDRGLEVSRRTSSNTTDFISNPVATSNEAIDPTAEVGKPIFALKRQSGVRNLRIELSELNPEPQSDIYLLAWDEYDPANALDGTFREGNKVLNSSETLAEVNTTCTSYTPQIAVQRGWDKVKAGDQNKSALRNVDTQDAIPIDATRVFTAVHDGTATDAEIQGRVIEGY